MGGTFHGRVSLEGLKFFMDVEPDLPALSEDDQELNERISIFK